MIYQYINELDTCINEGRSFAIYKIPGEDFLYLIRDPEKVTILHDIEELSGKKGFVIAPFRISENAPLVLLEGTQSKLPFNPPDIGVTLRRKRPAATSLPIDEAYSQRFATFTSPIKDKQYKKLVLSRSLTQAKEENFSPAKAFITACLKYTRSYSYLFYTPQTGAWMGSTPEILLAGKKDIWHTVAIAGTQPLQSGKLPTKWDDKNLIEQMLVAYYIRTQLSSFGIYATEKGPYTVRAGELAHLRSDFVFPLPDNNRLGSIVNLLHPTPAVSGLPKEEAYTFILENEGYDRKYYSGFIGWLDPDDKSDLYVNLRCMHIGREDLTLYAGGGLLPSSVLEDEWSEAEDKLQTMLYLAKTSNYVFE